jgi:hypothetical protein
MEMQTRSSKASDEQMAGALAATGQRRSGSSQTVSSATLAPVGRRRSGDAKVAGAASQAGATAGRKPEEEWFGDSTGALGTPR